MCRSRGDSEEGHFDGTLGAVLESVTIIRLATRAVVEILVPLGPAKAGFLSGCPALLFHSRFIGATIVNVTELPVVSNTPLYKCVGDPLLSNMSLGRSRLLCSTTLPSVKTTEVL